MTAWASGPDHFDQPLATRRFRPQITAAAEARHQNLHGEGVALEARTRAGEVIATGFVQIDDFADVDVDPEAFIQFSDRDQFLRVSGAGEEWVSCVSITDGLL
jgi:hypothetical protein